jgi:outer membrane receptor protein involved in Fe transport
LAVPFAGAMANAQPLPHAAEAAVGSGKVSGFVVDQTNGLPIPRATVGLYRGDTFVKAYRTDKDGEFRVESLLPGIYSVAIEVSGYQASRSHDFTVAAGQETSVNIAVGRATQSGESGTLKTIGSVSVSSTSTLASTTTITRTIDPALLQSENNLNLGYALAKLPGVNSTGLSSSISDDQYLNIRGLGASETQALLDGHPIGPQGVYGINGGGSYPTAFNYSNSPIFGLSKVQVTFGSGASGLYGVDAIGGTIDMQTLNPTLTQALKFSDGVGDQGREQTAFNFTGTSGKLAYALAAGVQGAYGMFAPGLVTQTGRPNNNANANNGGACLGNVTIGSQQVQLPDVSPCNTALNTYSVSQNTTLRSGLAKLRYDLSNNTSFTTTVFTSGQQSDSTGNGDNDNIPYDTRLAVVKNNPGNCALPTDPSGKTSGYLVVVREPSTLQCFTAKQLALDSYGPFGGGADRNRGANMADYDFKLQSTSGKNTITADGYYNFYKYYKSSEEASGLDPTGTEYAGTQYSQFVNTQGYLISDDIQNAKSDIGFGYFGQYQAGSRLDYNANGQGIADYETPESSHYNSGFVRASYEFNDKFSVFGNFWVKNDTTIGDTNFDPRLSLVFRPESADVFRVTFGHSTGDPAAELKAAGPPSINVNPTSINPTCTPYNQIGTGGNPGIEPERANDYEVGYAHRFSGDSSIQLNLYYTGVQNQLFQASEPLSQFGSVPISPTLLQEIANRIGSVCSGVNPADPATVLPFLSIGTTFNAASAVSKGIEFSGRQRMTRHLYFDYSYDLQSVVQNGINVGILSSNPFIINGAQVEGIPINQGTVGLDYANRGLEVRMDGYIVGSNNPSERPGYNTWNGFVSQALKRNLAVNVGVQNIFNQAWQRYGYFGHAPLIPENQYFNDTNPIQQYVNTGSNEEFGLPIRSFSLTLTSKV